jgi:ABC-2 type transport system permease protein
MNPTLTIARREFVSYFYSPIAYVALCVFVLLAGILFLTSTFIPGEQASLRWTFFYIVWVLIAVVPAISMRLVAEELRSGNIETLMTSPVSDRHVVVGKWLGGLGFFAALLSPTLVFVLLLSLYGTPEYGPIFTGYLGMLLVGGLYMAIGVFASVTTRNQIIAFLLTVFIILLFTVITYFLPRAVPAAWTAPMYYINVNEQYDDFSKGLVDTSNFIYFFGGIFLFLTLATATLESRKWR